MLEEMSFPDLLRWQAFDHLEPIGALRGDWQAASICAVLMNIEARRRGAPHIFTPAEMLLEFKEKESTAKEVEVPEATPRKSWQEMKMIGMMMAAGSQPPPRGKRRR